MSHRLDLVGKKFGKLTVVSFSHRDKSYQLFWNCICECGKKTMVNGRHLRSGQTKSCGCINASPSLILPGKLSFKCI